MDIKISKVTILFLGVLAVISVGIIVYFKTAEVHKVDNPHVFRTWAGSGRAPGSGQNIIFNAMPKSGSAYVREVLISGLGYRGMRISDEYIPRDQVSYLQLSNFYANERVLSKQHLDASVLNLQILRRFTDRLVVHVRDPREVLVSWVNYLNKLHKKGIDVYYVVPEPPTEYYSWDFNNQMDWAIENFLPTMVTWLQEWSDAQQREARNAQGIKIMFTTYDELIENEDNLYQKILAFYDIDKNNFTLKSVAKDDHVHFRNAELGEWRKVLSDEQKQRVAQLVPVSLLQQFGWSE